MKSTRLIGMATALLACSTPGPNGGRAEEALGRVEQALDGLSISTRSATVFEGEYTSVDGTLSFISTRYSSDRIDAVIETNGNQIIIFADASQGVGGVVSFEVPSGEFGEADVALLSGALDELVTVIPFEGPGITDDALPHESLVRNYMSYLADAPATIGTDAVAVDLGGISPTLDMDGDGFADSCPDLTGDGQPDECDPDGDGNPGDGDPGDLEYCDLDEDGLRDDLDNDGIPDQCCDADGDRVADDIDTDGTPDPCCDANGDGVPNDCISISSQGASAQGTSAGMTGGSIATALEEPGSSDGLQSDWFYCGPLNCNCETDNDLLRQVTSCCRRARRAGTATIDVQDYGRLDACALTDFPDTACGQATTECIGRCGRACTSPGMYMQDCFDHDECVENEGGGLLAGNLHCGDEFFEATEDFAFVWAVYAARVAGAPWWARISEARRAWLGCDL